VGVFGFSHRRIGDGGCVWFLNSGGGGDEAGRTPGALSL